MQTAGVALHAWRSQPWFAWLELVRPANVLTALADSLAGTAVAAAVAGNSPPAAILLLLPAASGCLYAGGVVLNDVFDSRLDAAERPERPLPSGRVRRRSAAVLGFLLLAAGIGLAAGSNGIGALLATAIALVAVSYNALAKHHAVAGPLCMGLCRGLNLLLGISASAAALAHWWPLMLVPMTYVAAITIVSRGEVHGGTRMAGWLSNALLLAVATGLASLVLSPRFSLLPALPFLAFLFWRVAPAFLRAAKYPDPDTIRHAVKTGVLSIICVNAVLGAGFGGMLYGLAILLLLPGSLLLARLFAVT